MNWYQIETAAQTKAFRFKVEAERQQAQKGWSSPCEDAARLFQKSRRAGALARWARGESQRAHRVNGEKGQRPHPTAWWDEARECWLIAPGDCPELDQAVSTAPSVGGPTTWPVVIVVDQEINGVTTTQERTRSSWSCALGGGRWLPGGQVTIHMGRRF